MPTDDRSAVLAALAMLLAAVLSSCASGPSQAQQVQARLQAEWDAQQAAWATEEARRAEQQEQDRRDMAAWREEPTADELAAADCGSPPPPGWRAALESALRATLRDPDSGVFRFAEPEKVGTKAGDGAPFEFLWKVYYEVNARNGFGGYTGFQSGAVYFKDGKWISIEEHLERQREWRESRGAKQIPGPAQVSPSRTPTAH